MGKVKIVTDSCANLDPAEAEALGITVVPLTVQIGDKIFEDGLDETTNEFLAHQARGTSPMEVLSPPVSEFEKLYLLLHRLTDQIVAIHVSGHLTDVWKNSRAGAEPLRGRCNIEVVDSKSVLLGQKILVTEAARAAQNGASVDEIVRLVRGLIPHIYTVLFVDDMQYLEKSGTIGKAQFILGTMMQIKPLLFMEDGEIIPMEKVKTVNKAVDKLTEFVSEFDELEQVVVLQPVEDPMPETEILLERLEQLFPDQEFPIMRYNPLLASFVGPSAMGLIVYEGLIQY